MVFKSLCLILLILGIIPSIPSFQYDDIAEDSKLSTPELVKKYGYDGEEHFVTTEDGYILALHRIQPVQNCERKPKPFILLHGFVSNSAAWVLQGPEKSLGYALSDACYDVWMPNNRGNVYSRNHTTLSTNSWKFWNFTFHEMGIYDLPAIIDYILAETKSPDVFFLGYSQGASVFFVFETLKPEYQKKVRAMVALGPVAFLGNLGNNFLKTAAFFEKELALLLAILQQKELLRQNRIVQGIGSILSRDEFPISQEIILQGLFSFTGLDRPVINTTILPVFVGHFPDGISLKLVAHYGQLVNSGRFCMFDYGWWINLQRYGQKTPPDYPLENIKTPLVFWQGQSDNIATANDVEILKTKLKTSLEQFLVPWEKFNHLDFAFATNAKKLIYEPIISTFDNL